MSGESKETAPPMRAKTKVVRFVRRAPRGEILVRFRVAQGEDPEAIAELIQANLNRPIDDLDLDPPTREYLKGVQITHLWELLRLSIEDLYDQGFRSGAIRQIQQAVASLNNIALFRRRADYLTAFGRKL